MDDLHHNNRHAVLYVDDEPKALKYFRKAFEDDFTILTASDVDEALQVLDEHSEDIGVLVTDQRMPGKQGTELLFEARLRCPRIVRILTTAYSELDSAIEAVNSGEVFRYIVKPWNLRELRGTLLRAMDYFEAQRERDILLREKLSVVQRMVILDRVRSFTVLAATLTFRLRHSMTALKAFFDLAPVHLNEPADPSTVHWADLWNLAQNQLQRMVDNVDNVLRSTVDAKSYAFEPGIDLCDVVREQVATALAATEQRGVRIETDIANNLPTIKADASMLQRLVRILLQRIVELTPADHVVQVQAKVGEPIGELDTVSLTVRRPNLPLNGQDMASLFDALRQIETDAPKHGMDMLAAFFIAHHHGGDMRIHPSAPAGPGLELVLPIDPEAVHKPHLKADWLDRIFTQLEPWDESATALPSGMSIL